MASNKQFTCRWAFLSCSSIASVFLPDIILPRDDSEPIKHEIVAVSTTGANERVQNWLAEHKVPNASSVKIYNSWQEMLETGDFDIVYISTPHPLHYEHVRTALNHKRNVLVEKPATMNKKQYEVLSQLAKDQNVVLMEAMWTRYLPAAQYFRNELLPKIGRVKRVYAEFSFPIYSTDMPLSSRFLDKNAGAGALLDQGVYALTWVDLALNGIASVAESTSTHVTYANNIPVVTADAEVDDVNTLILATTDNKSQKQTAVSIVTTSMTLPGSNKPSFYHRFQAKKAAPAVRIEAEYASVAVPFPPIRPEEFQVQWYGQDFVDAEGLEKNEVIKKPVERGWGIWYQADVIAKRVLERQNAGNASQGEVIEEQESLRVLGWMDEARKLAGIKFDPKLDEI
jgi:predicted dehydrogenase